MNEITKELLDALKGAVAQMNLAAECVERGRHDEAILHLRSLTRGRSEAIAKAKAFLAAPQPSADEPVTDSYVQTVPDKCDRIVWRGRYIHLSVGQETTPQPADDGWIPWNGGDCPVEVGTRVDAKYRDGETAYNIPAEYCAEYPCSGSALDWSHMENDYDIIAYRVVKP